MEECEYCGDEFKNNRGLGIHKGQEHSKLGDYVCDYCERSYDSKDSLRCHERDRHPKKGKFECNHCNNQFRNTYGLNLHISHKHESYTKEQLIEKLHEFVDQFDYLTCNDFCNNPEYPNLSYFKKYFGSFSEARVEAGLENYGVNQPTNKKLHTINKKFKNNKQANQIITGLLMGDGSIGHKDRKNPLFEINLINKEFLEFIDKELGDISNGVKLQRTAKESVDCIKDQGLRPNAHEDNYHDIFRLRTKSLEHFKKYKDWYNTGRKKFPLDLNLTPLVLKMWFVTDGGLRWKKNSNCYPIFYMKNESNRLKHWSNVFHNKGMNNFTGAGRKLIITEKEKFFNYIGHSPSPGFDYKWCYKNYKNYQKKKNKFYSKDDNND